MSNDNSLMKWIDEQTAQVPDRGVTELALKIFNQIDAEMKRQGITQTELARRAQVNRAFVSRILNNPGNVTLSTIVALANALDLEVQVPELTPRTAHVVVLAARPDSAPQRDREAERRAAR